jgi:hypothetical protein
VRRRVAAIADHHRRRGIGFAATDPAISKVLRSLPRRHREPEQPAALTEAELPHLIATCRADLPGVRDRALFLVSLAGGFSRSALVAIDHHHLHIDADGAVIAMPSGSRNRERPAEIRLPRLADPELCPVRALEDWLQQGNIRRGAVFRGISAHGVVEARLTSAGVRHILLQRAALAKRMAQTDKIPAPHGRRVGLITKPDPTSARGKPTAAHTRPTNGPAQRRDRQLASGDSLERPRAPLADRRPGQGAEARGVHTSTDTDWLLNRLTVSGPVAEVARFRVAARGTSAIPWSLDLDQEEARLLAPMASAGPEARALARQLRAVIAARHARVLARWHEPGACPLDLHRLIPVTDSILALGEDDPAAQRWLWAHWGTTRPLRGVRVCEESSHRRLRRTARVVFEFRSADWTPWQAIKRLRTDWPTLTFAVQPHYDDE